MTTRLKKLSRLGADRKGSAALEFAMVAPIFFTLLLGIFEAGILFFAQFALQNAVQDAGRLVRTGQAQNFTQTQFKNAICGEVSALMDCGKLQVDVEAFDSYGSVSYQTPLKPDGTMNSDLTGYNVGAACSVVLVRAFYTWPVWAPVMEWFLVNMQNGSGSGAHLLAAATAFRNEPFNNDAAGC